MVRLNDIDILDIAPVQIVDIIIGKPEIKITTKDEPVRIGEYFARRKYGKRKVTVQFTLPVEDQEERERYIAKIDEWANTDEPVELRLRNHDGRYLMAVSATISDPSMRDWGELLEIVFECPDPAWNADSESVVACGTSFNVVNKLPALWRIEAAYTSTKTDPEWVLDSTNTMALDGDVAAGTLIFDSSDRTIELDGASIADQFATPFQFFELTQGAHVITGDGFVFWRERWI